MLRFSYSHDDRGEQWDLCGQLAGPWVEELCALWRRVRAQAPNVDALVDLRDVTFIDEGGERLLSEMRADGARFAAAGVEHKHLLDNMNDARPAGVRRHIKHWSGGCA